MSSTGIWKSWNYLVRVMLVPISLLSAAALQAESRKYVFNSERSILEVFVPRAGLMSLFGHDHTILAEKFSGSVDLDSADQSVSRLELTVPVQHMAVADTDVSDSNRDKIEMEMHGEAVLDKDAFPEIHFEADSVVIRDSGTWEVSGLLTIRGITRNLKFTASVSFPSESELVARGTVALQPQSFGIEPVSVMGGTIRTASTIEIRFTIRGLESRNG